MFMPLLQIRLKAKQTSLPIILATNRLRLNTVVAKHFRQSSWSRQYRARVLLAEQERGLNDSRVFEIVLLPGATRGGPSLTIVALVDSIHYMPVSGCEHR